MKTLTLNFWGTTRYWWAVLIVGILLVLFGFVFLFWPIVGSVVASQIFGWLCVCAGIISLCVSAGRNRPRGWAWWLVGGIINMFIGFMLIGNLLLSLSVFPIFVAIMFLYWGISAIFSSFSITNQKGWWLYLINGILLTIIGMLLMGSNFFSQLEMVDTLTAIAFIYWGFCLSVFSADIRPVN